MDWSEAAARDIVSECMMDRGGDFRREVAMVRDELLKAHGRGVADERDAVIRWLRDPDRIAPGLGMLGDAWAMQKALNEAADLLFVSAHHPDRPWP